MRIRFVIVATLVPYFSIVVWATRTMYVDGFSSILGNTTAENLLLQYAQSNQISTLLLYELHLVGLPGETAQANLANFISKAKNTYGISKVGAIAENAWYFENRIDTYNNSRSSASEKFDIYNLEFEFWNTPLISSGGYYCVTYLQPNSFPCDTTGSFDFFIQEIIAIHTLAQNNSHDIETETYVGWLNEGQAREIRRELDQVRLHAYVNSPSNAYPYAEERLIFFSADNQLTDISIIISAEPTFMQSWLQSNSMQAAENIITNDYNAAGGTWQSYINLTGYTYFAYSFMTNIALPAEWCGLFAKQVKQGVTLTWRTASETQNAHFLVQHSTDGRSFQDLAQIPGKGDSQVENHYEYLHENPSHGTNYYRLEQVDLDGGFEYSHIVCVEFGAKEKVQLYPNPFSNTLQIDIQTKQDELPARLFDVTGRQVWQGSLRNGQQALELPGLQAGVFWMEVDFGNRTERLRVVKN